MTAQATKHKLLEITAEDERGQGARIFMALKEAKVNVEATCIWPSNSQAFFWIVPDDFVAARKALRKAGYKNRTIPAVRVEMSNKPGAMAEVLEKIAAAGIDATVAFLTTSVKKNAVAYITTSADTKAVKAINK